MTLDEAVRKPKKNLWLTIGLSVVAAFLVWQRLAPSARPDVANAKQGARVVVLVGAEMSADAFARELGFPVRDHTQKAATTAETLARLDPALAEKPNYVVLRVGGQDLVNRTPLEDTLRALEGVITKAQAQGALVAVVTDKPEPGVGDNWLMAVRDLYRQHRVLVVEPRADGRVEAPVAVALKPFL